MNYYRFLNAVSAARKPMMLRVLTAIQAQSPPTMISMATGMPNVELFPFREAEFRLSDGNKLKIDSASMKQALQYSPSQGIAGLVDWIKQLQERVHDPPLLTPADPNHPGRTQLAITTGSMDGLCKAMEALVSKGDNVLMESALYPGALAAVQPLGCNIRSVKTDSDGLDPDDLQKVMSKWTPEDATKSDSDIPKLLYCVPNGGNPTGHGLTLKRKEKIYKIAQTYDLVILEDDPYFYLQFNKPRVPSFLSLDTDGRVLRFDSFSKVLSSGMRVGFVTGPRTLVDRIILHMQASVLHCSSLSQVLLLKLLQDWGSEGFDKHVEKVASFYRERRDICLKMAEKHLKGLADWSEPTGGMFLWIKLDGIPDTYKLILEKAREKEVLFVPGSIFLPDYTSPSSYMRAAYSLATPEQMDEGFRRLAQLIREEVSCSV
ncbi:kynurenine/alpha-aminoadipate aminotransferase, mitochondrial-like [Liolophura sinensis]|uniref:kynurenine/alpha-aminoadipate aminotransferase, mitochondrial-like n=1 Tax=Liolophura sinensis TaxID=3198878 RepID=UPI0031590612